MFQSGAPHSVGDGQTFYDVAGACRATGVEEETHQLIGVNIRILDKICTIILAQSSDYTIFKINFNHSVFINISSIRNPHYEAVIHDN
ncbi:MAG: hypothetical protein CVV51_01015 [Spirochaetae bacterium HGW-Spirochaetae-7]|nr:MAG: hypothetical protein CVV51_01015 [Spirochaetae bacterium HGW-Spirochaetae-7]